jgi:hypothetical protein
VSCSSREWEAGDVDGSCVGGFDCGAIRLGDKDAIVGGLLVGVVLMDGEEVACGASV